MAIINTYPAKTTPVGADIFNVWDSASSAVKTVTITNLSATVATLVSGSSSIALAGDIGGTLAATAIGTGVIVNANISASAAIALSKLDTDPLARANHTGTQALATISDAGTMASQNANAVAITGGALSGLTSLAMSGGHVLSSLDWYFDDISGNGGRTWRFRPRASGDTSGTSFSATMQSVLWTNGPVGETNYYDNIAHFGWNWVGGTREDTGQPGFGISMESKYYQDGTFVEEFHIQGEDEAGTAYRPFTIIIPTEGSLTTSSAKFRVNKFSAQALGGTDLFSVNEATNRGTFNMPLWVTPSGASDFAVRMQPTSASYDQFILSAVRPVSGNDAFSVYLYNDGGGSSWYSEMRLGDATKRVVLSSSSGGMLTFRTSSADRWHWYTAGSTTRLYLYDAVNGRNHITHRLASTADGADTAIQSRVQIGADENTDLGTLSVVGTSSSAIAQVIRLASGATAHALTIEDNSGTDLVSIRSDGRIRWESSDSAPSDTTTPDAWITVYVGATAYRMPLYTP